MKCKKMSKQNEIPKEEIPKEEIYVSKQERKIPKLGIFYFAVFGAGRFFEDNQLIINKNLLSNLISPQNARRR